MSCCGCGAQLLPWRWRGRRGGRVGGFCWASLTLLSSEVASHRGIVLLCLFSPCLSRVYMFVCLFFI